MILLLLAILSVCVLAYVAFSYTKVAGKTTPDTILPEQEETYAKTPINKVDDYELTRIIGSKKEDYNQTIMNRVFDWADLPFNSEERRTIAPRGLMEGFTNDISDAEVMQMIEKEYNDSEYEPVIVKVGTNHWEVNELKPKFRQEKAPEQGDQPALSNDVAVAFQHRETHVLREAIDPYYSYQPNMERMFGPTFDRASWS